METKILLCSREWSKEQRASSKEDGDKNKMGDGAETSQEPQLLFWDKTYNPRHLSPDNIHYTIPLFVGPNTGQRQDVFRNENILLVTNILLRSQQPLYFLVTLIC